MRVAFVMPGLGVVPRGAEAFVIELATALVRDHGLHVTLFGRGDVPGFPTERVWALRRDQPWLTRLYGASRFGRKVLDTLFLDPLNLEWATASLAALGRLWRGRYDLVVIEGGLVGAWLCRLLRRVRGVPFVDIAHGNSPKWEGAFARQGPDRVVTFTADTAAMIRQRAPRARVEIVPHGVDLDRFRPDGPAAPLGLPRPRVLVAGAVDDNKRFHLALEAVAELPQGSLVVLGDGPEAAALDQQAAALLGPARYLRRAVAREDMPAWYRAVDVFTLPSRLESFGLTYLEALACGVPVVAPDDAVRREVVGAAGILVDVSDRAAYTAALAAAGSARWGEAPRNQARRFDFATTAARYASMFRTIVEERTT